MHKDFWNSNQKRSLIQKRIDEICAEKLAKLPASKVGNFANFESIFDIPEVKNLIEKRVKIVGRIVPIAEEIIKKRLLNFVKKNRVAMRSGQSCCRYIKQFDATAFLYCEVCDEAHKDLGWYSCKNCGSFNKYKI
jgi:hypothetical protein